MLVNLVVPGPLPATGMPTVTAASGTTAYEEDNELTASTAGINEPNRINNSTVRWTWRIASAADGDLRQHRRGGRPDRRHIHAAAGACGPLAERLCALYRYGGHGRGQHAVAHR